MDEWVRSHWNSDPIGFRWIGWMNGLDGQIGMDDMDGWIEMDGWMGSHSNSNPITIALDWIACDRSMASIEFPTPRTICDAKKVMKIWVVLCHGKAGSRFPHFYDNL